VSFAGNYATTARLQAHNLAAVLEVTLNEAQWLTDAGTLSTAMNMSDTACRARGKAYDPRVIAGGWKSVRQEIEVRVAGLSSLTTSVTVADTDNRVRDALVVGGNQRNSAARIYRVVPGSTTDYDSRFTGLVDSWSFAPNQVTLNLRTDDRVMRTHWPAWPYLKSEWFQMALDSVNEYAAHCYGKHDATALGLDHGMLPTVPVWLGANSWYAVALGPLDQIKDVFVGGVLATPTTDWVPVYGSLAGGKIFSIVEFQPGQFPAVDAVVTVNASGYAAVNDGTYDGTATLTNPVAQIRHFIINFAVNRTRGYIPGAWDAADPLIDATTWNAAEDYAQEHGLEGARFMQDQRSVDDTFTEWLESFPMFRPYWSSDGTIKMRILDATWPGYWDDSTPIISREDDIASSFRYEVDAREVTGKISCQYLYDSVQGQFLRTLDVQDLGAGEIADSQLSMYWSPARQV